MRADDALRQTQRGKSWKTFSATNSVTSSPPREPYMIKNRAMPCIAGIHQRHQRKGSDTTFQKQQSPIQSMLSLPPPNDVPFKYN